MSSLPLTRRRARPAPAGRRAGRAWPIALAAVAVACAARLTPAAPAATVDGVRFVVELPDAASVTVAGTFNEWSVTAHPLARAGTRGVWTGTIVMPPGEHAFMYVADGERWVSPPHAEDYADDGFGAKNGVISVGPR